MSDRIPEIVKAKRDLVGSISITLKDDAGKEFEKAFASLRSGICWPFRAMPGYFCVVGLLSGAQVGAEGSMMLVYEREYQTTNDLMLDVLNRVRDLRIAALATDRDNPNWIGFNADFDRKAREQYRDLALKHSPYATDFQYGVDVIRRWGRMKAISLPPQTIIMDQLRSMTPADLQSETPQNRFHAVNGLRYVAVLYDLQARRHVPLGFGQSSGRAEPTVSPLGWT